MKIWVILGKTVLIKKVSLFDLSSLNPDSYHFKLKLFFSIKYLWLFLLRGTLFIFLYSLGMCVCVYVHRSIREQIREFAKSKSLCGSAILTADCFPPFSMLKLSKLYLRKKDVARRKRCLCRLLHACIQTSAHQLNNNANETGWHKIRTRELLRARVTRRITIHYITISRYVIRRIARWRVRM